MHRVTLLAVCLLAVALAVGMGCNRRIEPFDASEQPHQPDLSKIFPEGAERAAALEPGLPSAPGGAPARGAPPLLAGSGGSDGAPISGSVRIAPELSARVPDGAVLFLIARHGSGGPPLAVKRIAEPRFPLDFSIGPDDRMIETMAFEGPVQITARIDRDGNAMSRDPGDLQGAAAGSFEPGATGVDLLIDEALGSDVPSPPGGVPARGAPPVLAGSGGPDGAPISGSVRIAPELSARVPDGAVLFLIARRGSAGPPLAVKRIASPRFPLDFSIGPDDRMIRTMPFEGPIQITARVDGDGNAMSRNPGDLQGAAAGSVEPGATGIALLIDEAL